MNNLKNRYLYYEQATEKEFWIVWTATQRFLRFIYKIKRTVLFAGLFLLTTIFKLTFEIAELLLEEPTLYKSEEPNKIAEEVESVKNNWRVF